MKTKTERKPDSHGQSQLLFWERQRRKMTTTTERKPDSHRQSQLLFWERQRRKMTTKGPDSHMFREATAHYRLNPKVRHQYHRLLPSYWPRLVFAFPLVFINDFNNLIINVIENLNHCYKLISLQYCIVMLSYCSH